MIWCDMVYMYNMVLYVICLLLYRMYIAGKLCLDDPIPRKSVSFRVLVDAAS